jgi:hypothetical protein
MLSSTGEGVHFAIAKAARRDGLELLLLDEVHYPLRLLRLRSSTRSGRAQAAFSQCQSILAALHAEIRRRPTRSCATIV